MAIKVLGLDCLNYKIAYLYLISYEIYKTTSIDIDITENDCSINIDSILENTTSAGFTGKILDECNKPVQNLKLSLSLIHYIYGEKVPTIVALSETTSDGIFDFNILGFSKKDEYIIAVL